MENELDEYYEQSPRYKVYKIKNNLPGASQNKTYFMISNYVDDEAIRARVRSMLKSRTAAGGAKALAQDMHKVGDDKYDEAFDLKPVSKGMNKKQATEMRNRLSKSQKASSQKIYNKIKPGANSNFDL
jgi:hypothetical protein